MTKKQAGFGSPLEFLRKYADLFGIAAFSSLSCYFLLILLSYDAQDIHSLPANVPPKTFFGYGGAFMAEKMYHWFGVMAYFFPLVLLVVAFLIYRVPRPYWMRGGWVLLTILSMLWLCTAARAIEKFPPVSSRMPSHGGILGIFLFQLLQKFFRRGVFWVLAAMVAALLFYGFSLIFEQHLKHETK